MRSRYSAYVLRLEDYMLASWHPDTRPSVLGLADDKTQWLGLTIRGVKAGRPGDDSGEISFTAQFRVGRERHRLDEDSRFIRQGGRWVYLDDRGEKSQIASASAQPR